MCKKYWWCLCTPTVLLTFRNTSALWAVLTIKVFSLSYNIYGYIIYFITWIKHILFCIKMRITWKRLICTPSIDLRIVNLVFVTYTIYARPLKDNFNCHTANICIGDDIWCSILTVSFSVYHRVTTYTIPAKSVHKRDIVSGHFNLFHCMGICDRLSRHLFIWTENSELRKWFI